ncbi:MAG: 16S rRNA pseudouridine(516) synthase [Luteolibacter sp.]
MKLNRLIAKHQSLGRSAAQRRIAAGNVRVDGTRVTDGQYEVDRFQHVELADETVQTPERRLCLILHKPAGILSATADPVHPTVIDLIDDPDKHTLHLVGRLDRATTGLMLLTNDGRWSKTLMAPERKVEKSYLVTTRDPISASAVEDFRRGFYFHTEDLTTLPAGLEILSSHTARLILHEGRYHQVKRMFHRIRNQVIALHRERIGNLTLPPDLAPGEWRALTLEEIQNIRFSPNTPL